jgi:hypothetical protein
MGVNYYLQTKKCPTCGHTPTPIHLGKSSVGWQFAFQWNGGQFYKNIEEMKEWLKGKVIVDEYDKETNFDDFWKMIEEKQSNPLNQNHAEYCKIHYPESSRYDFVIDGYSFTDREFS